MALIEPYASNVELPIPVTFASSEPSAWATPIRRYGIILRSSCDHYHNDRTDYIVLIHLTIGQSLD